MDGEYASTSHATNAFVSTENTTSPSGFARDVESPKEPPPRVGTDDQASPERVESSSESSISDEVYVDLKEDLMSNDPDDLEDDSDMQRFA